MKQEYRPDIDGLRAVAVVAVVLYHAFPGWLPGGFVGVDVFFVISGFLISGIIFADLEAGSFSYREFYRRRVIRIFPALMVVLLATLAAGWFLLLPDEFRELGLQAVLGTSSLANVLFWHQSGYFNAASSTKPLLHLWSLGVEEQFYFVWPLLLVTSYRRSRSALFAILAVIVGSFVWNVSTIRADPTAAFYLPMSRMWELGLGALLAYQLRQPRESHKVFSGLSPIGLLLIVASMVVIKPTYQFPGWWAVLPCLGAVLVIATRGAMLNRVLLAHPVMVFIGRISYPLYLWHWVLLTLPHLATGSALSRGQRIAAVAASVVLAWFTYAVVEKRVRSRRYVLLRPAALAAFMGLTGLAATLAYATDGAAFRYPASIRSLVDIQHDVEKERYRGVWRMGTCFLSDAQTFETMGDGCAEFRPHDDGRSIVLWGDSYAASLYPGIKALQQRFSIRLAQFTKAECLPVIGMVSFPSCKSSNDAVLNRIRALNPQTVILGGDWTSDLNGGEANFPSHMDQLRSTVRTLREAGVQRVIVFGALPRWTINQPRVALRLWQQFGALPDRTLQYLDTRAADADGRVATAVAGTGAVFVSPLGLLCNARGCLLSADEHAAVPISWDAGHLTEAGSVLLVKLAAPVVF